MHPMTDEEFEDVIQEALDAMPDRFLRALDNVGITYEDEPSAEQQDCADWGTSHEGTGELLGLYEGLPLTERGGDYGGFGCDVPDVITIFKGPHERAFATRGQMVEEIKKTVIHEIGHYFGLDEDQLAAMGY